ncbi:MAG TPA: glycoside hydrolase family 20 zincin-like fold domain-containing protein [Phycisphaerae bacterium]|nr:glycoside hydrolase family 20 zincin-like fold domain-containing protein [Phycisphaerae bacterium]
MPAPDFLVPVKRCEAAPGVFRVPEAAALSGAAPGDALPLGQLAGDLAPHGVSARVAAGAGASAAVRIRRDSRIAGAEAYEMTIGPDSIEICASADAGAYYAVQTLRELVALHGREIPACEIGDGPDLARRGVYHDCSRGKVPTLETLKALVERLARWKVNELELYVENVFTFRRHPAIGRGYSPFTADEVRALADHCRAHHVRLVGSLASFGHMEKILALPAYQHLGELAGYRGWPSGTTLCPTDPGSIALLADLYAEFVPLFEARDFNACCDETWELGRGRSKPEADRIGVGRVYLEFFKKVHALCVQYGKRMNAWADIVLEHPETLADVPRDACLLNWDYHPEGTRIGRTREIREAGLAVMVCPGTNAWNSHGCRLRMGMENIARFAEEGLASGAEGLLNTDWGDGGHRNPLAVSLHNLAYGAAHAWNHAATRAEGFTERFCRLALGDSSGRLADAVRTLGGAHEALGLEFSNSTLLYTTFLGPVEDFLGPEHPQCAALDRVSAAALAKHAEALSALRWPTATEDADAFLAATMEEYAFAAKLDALACRRAAALKQLRAGKTPAAEELRRLADATDETARDLERVWLLGNRPSRLRDILEGLAQAVSDYRRLAL